MKQLKTVLIALLFAFLPGLLLVHAAGAQRFSGDIAQGQTVNGSLYAARKTITIKGTVNGDIFCAGQQVTIDATVTGDIICAAKELTITGKIDGDIRLAGQTVSVDAVVTRSATVVAGAFSLDASASVGRDLTVTASEANIKGTVGRDIVGSAAELVLNGKVGRNVTAQSDSLQLRNRAAVAGTVHYTSTNRAQIAKGAQLDRTGITRHTPKNQGALSASNLMLLLIVFSGMLLVSLVLVLLAPRFLQQTTAKIMQSVPRALLIGFIASIALPIVTIAAGATLVGIPLAILLALLWVLGLFLSGPVAGYFVGRLILKDKRPPVVLMLAGSALTLGAYALPIVGFMCMIAAYWIGLGGLVSSAYSSQKLDSQTD